MELQGKIIREEYFPFLVENGFDSLGILLWIDYGHYFKVQLNTVFQEEKTELKQKKRCEKHI